MSKPAKKDVEKLRRKLAAEAAAQLGKPYDYGAWWQDAPKKFDCSSFSQYLYKKIGIRLPRISIDQAREGRRIPANAASLKVGDLIFIRGRNGRYNRHFPKGIGHVIVVTGPDEVIHARYRREHGRDGGCVVKQKLSTILKRKDITVIKRYL